MLKVTLSGTCNFFFKLPKTNSQTQIGFINIYFFIFYLTGLCKQTPKINILYLKKNRKRYVFLKSYFKSKISKHKITHHAYKFKVNLLFTNLHLFTIYDLPDIYNVLATFKRFNLFSSPLMSVTYSQIETSLYNTNHLLR